MKNYPHIKENKRDFVRKKRKYIKAMKKLAEEVRSGCAIKQIYGPSNDMLHAINDLYEALSKIDIITKQLAK